MNSNRIQAVDLGRGMSVFIMVMVHTLWMYGDIPTQSESTLGMVLHMLGKGTASFLVAMGICFMLTKNASVSSAMVRGVYILGIGYFMNALKFLLPIIFNTVPESFIAAYGWEAPLTSGQLRYLLLTGDILQLAGVCLLFMGLIRKFMTNKYLVLALAVAIMIAARFVSGIRVGHEVVDYLLDMLWSKHYNIYFPVFPWFSCILVGMFFGMWYVEKQRDQDFMFSRMLAFGAIMVAIGGGLMAYDYKYHFGDFFHIGAGGICYLIGLNLIGLWILYKITRRVKHNRFFALLEFFSSRVTSLYVIQWTLVCWGMGIIGYQTLNAWQLAAMIPVMIALTVLVQVGREKIFAKPKPVKQAAMA